MIKIFFKLTLTISVILIVLTAIYFIFMTITDYRPEEIIPLTVENNVPEIVKKDSALSVLTYNIGYCGLDKNQDFFMDGGTGSRSESKEKTLENLIEITNFIKEEKSSFVLLQEVDINATRSYRVNQYKYFKDNTSQYNSTFAINYKVPWVPVPIKKPMGAVKSGLATFSKYKTEAAARYQYPGKEKWPRQLALLDRCFIENRIPVEGGRELVLVNSHLSAYDKGGFMREQQLAFLKEYVTKEYKNGNYVVVGGDWNHLIPGTDPSVFKINKPWPEWLKRIPEDFKPEGFVWAADESVPTNRTNDVPYINGQNYLSVIDGFLVSSNIEILSVKGHSLEFQYSDHNPVTMEFKLR
jgi:endonuclease/exonuclease/phosphatase family metal-dependent hydrolase